MAVRTAFSDGISTGWIDRGLGLVLSILLLMAGVAICVFGMTAFNSQVENATSNAPSVTSTISDFGQADE